VKERTILFDGADTRAILAGAKTQFRRVVEGQAVTAGPANFPMAGLGWENDDDVLVGWREHYFRCPYGSAGDRLWVRETFAFLHCEDADTARPHWPLKPVYRADGGDFSDCETEDGDPFRWRPPIQMPRWASRIVLEITDVRIHRLQAIGEDGARAEGGYGSTFGRGMFSRAFDSHWDAINGKRAPWSSNPWVWAISFRRVTP
jgi:hypothetical protein